MYYKYLHFKDEKEFEILINGTLINPSLMFVPPFSLNDPNEFKINLAYDTSDISKLEARFLEDNPDLTKVDFQDFLISISNESFVWTTKNEIRAQLMLCTKICSLSKTHKSNLLWCHYTDTGKGFCIIYKNSLISYLYKNHLISSSGDVIYSDCPPLLTLPKDSNDEMLNKITFYKEKCWFYEKEYRITVENTDLKTNTFVSIPNEQIFGVIIGSKMEDFYINELDKVAKINNYQLFYMTEMGSDYKTKIVSSKMGHPMRQFIKK